MREIEEEISKKIITREDLIFFLEEIEILKGFIFKNPKINLSEKVRGKLSEEFIAWIEGLENKKIIPPFPHQQILFFEELKKFLLNLPQLNLEIAFQPSSQFILKIKNWLKENTGKEMIIDYLVNPEIGGGAIIKYGGKYLNFSLSKKINKSVSEMKI